jgi:hypothetical protein
LCIAEQQFVQFSPRILLPSFNTQRFVSQAEIEAGFILLVPESQIASQGGTLEKEIYNQIGVPNSKV